MGTRIQQLLKAKGLTHQEVAAQLGVSRQAVQKWAAGTPPAHQNLVRLADVLGVKPTFIMDESPISDEEVFAISKSGVTVREGWTRVPMIDISASCGHGSAGNDFPEIIGSADFADAFLRSLPGVTSINRFEIINSNGDSMEPTIERRSFCLIDRTQTRITMDAIFCIQTQSDLFIKRVMRNFDGTITLLSDNPKYPPQTIPREMMESATVIGRVVFVFNGKEI